MAEVTGKSRAVNPAGGLLCRWSVRIFALCYLLAIVLFAIGTVGLLGSPSGPLAGVFLIPLGLPWNLLLDPFPDVVRPWLALAAPAANLLLFRALCRWSARRDMARR